MECNEVFSVSMSAVLGPQLSRQRRKSSFEPHTSGDSATFGLDDVIMLSNCCPPVESLRRTAVAAAGITSKRHGKPSLQQAGSVNRHLPSAFEQRQRYQAMMNANETTMTTNSVDGDTPAVLQVDYQTFP